MKKGWEIKKLSEVCKKESSNVSQNQLSNDDGKYPIYGASGFIKNVSFYHQDKEYVSIIKDGAGIGKISLLPAYSSVIGTSQYLIPNNILDIRYFYYFLSNIDFWKYKNGSTIPHIYFKDYANESILVPPIPEQKRIGKILDEAFEAIDKKKANAERNINNSKELIANYLHNIVTNKSSGWQINKLSEVAEYFNGLTYSPNNISNEGIIVLRSSNVQNDELDFTDIVRVNIPVKDKIIVKDGDILMCSRNGSKRLIGKSATIKNLDEVMTFGTFMMIIRSKYNPYLSWFFKSNYFRKQLIDGESTMINQITRYMLDDVIIPLPPIKIQNEIVKKLDSLITENKKLEAIYKKKIDNLEELKKSILQKAFNGELETSKIEVA